MRLHLQGRDILMAEGPDPTAVETAVLDGLAATGIRAICQPGNDRLIGSDPARVRVRVTPAAENAFGCKIAPRAARDDDREASR